MRLNLEISNAQMNSLKALQQRTNANSMKDLVNHALTLLEWAVDETANGNEIAAINEKNSAYRVLVTPLLQHIGKTERKRNDEVHGDVSAVSVQAAANAAANEEQEVAVGMR